MDKRSIISLLVILVVVFLAGWVLFGGEESAAPTVFTFDSPVAMNGWVVQGNGSINISSGSLAVANKGESYLISPPFYVNTEEYPIFKIIAEVDPPLLPLQIFWLPQNQNQFDFSQNFDLDPGISSGLKTYYFNFKNTPRQPMGVARLLFKLPVGTEQFNIKEITFLKEENKQGLIAAWQAFWTVPPVTVRMVNRINPPFWGSTSLITIFYWLIVFSLILALVVYGLRSNFKKFELQTYLLKIMMLVIIVLLVSWVAYDLRFSFDYLRTVYRQANSFALKSADYKREVVFGKQITGFARYCKEQLPSNSKYTLKAQDEYQRMAITNLVVPLYWVDNADKAEYVIGFNVAAEEIKGFKPYCSYNNGQGWILKKEGN